MCLSCNCIVYNLLFRECDQQIWAAIIRLCVWKTGGKWFKLVSSPIRPELEHPSRQFLPQKQQGIKSGIQNISSTLFFLLMLWNNCHWYLSSFVASAFLNTDMLRAFLQGLIFKKHCQLDNFLVSYQNSFFWHLNNLISWYHINRLKWGVGGRLYFFLSKNSSILAKFLAGTGFPYKEGDIWITPLWYLFVDILMYPSLIFFITSIGHTLASW